MAFAEPIARLIAELVKLPGIGPKTAQRLAFHLLRRPREDSLALADAIREACERVVTCSICCNLTDRDPCGLCGDPQRDEGLLCVVEEPRDVAAFERMGGYRGRYHVLHGVLSPMDGIGPEQLRVRELLARIAAGGVREVVLAMNPTVEGEATAVYLARLLKPTGVRVTRLARGLPEGGDLDYVDEITLSRAFEGRREL